MFLIYYFAILCPSGEIGTNLRKHFFALSGILYRREYPSRLSQNYLACPSGVFGLISLACDAFCFMRNLEPKSKLKFVTLDKESNMNTLCQREEFLRICSEKHLAEKSHEILLAIPVI